MEHRANIWLVHTGSLDILKLPFDVTDCGCPHSISLANLSALILLESADTVRDQRTGRLFRKMRYGKPTKMAIGIHKVAEIPRKVARFLGKEQPDLYTGHAFRRTGATILAEAGLSISLIQNAGDWQSSSVAEGYIDGSNRMKETIAHAFNSTEASYQCAVSDDKVAVIANAFNPNATFIPQPDIENVNPNGKACNYLVFNFK